MGAKFKYQVTSVTKTWADPDDHDAGVNVSTGYNYAYDEEEARVMAKRMIRDTPDAIQSFSFYTKITVVEQRLEGD